MSKKSTSELIPKFADNECPSGDDFKNLIESSFNKVDGPIQQEDDGSVQVNTDATFLSDVKVEGALTAETQLSVGDSSLSGESLTVGEVLEANASGLTAHTEAQFNGKARFSAHTEINKAESSEEPALSVSGGVQTDTLSLDEKIVLGGTQAQAFIQVEEGKDSLLVKTDEGETQLALDDKGQLSLGLSGEQSSAKLHIRHHQEDGDVLLRIDNRANDETPVAITSDGHLGIGSASPFNTLDVSGSASIGHSALVSPENSLSVQNRLGIGTASPMARMDLHTLHNETAMIVRSGDAKLLHINDEQVTTDVALTVQGDTQLRQDANIKGDLGVNGELSVNGTAEFANSATVQGNTDVKGVLTAAADTQLQTATAHEKLTLKKELIVEGDAKHAASVGIGVGVTDSHVPNARLHIREGDEQIALKIDNKLQKQQLLVTTGFVELGEEGQAEVNLAVHGATTIAADMAVHGAATIEGDVNAGQDVTVKGHVQIQDGLALEKQLSLHQGKDAADQTALSITTEGINDALQVTHLDDDQVSHSLITAKVDRVGIHTKDPKAAFHVSGQSQFDHEASFKSQLGVDGDVSAKANLDVTGELSVNLEGEKKAQVHIGYDAAQANLRVDGTTEAMPALAIKDGKLGIGTEASEKRLDVKGDTRVVGQLDVNDLLTATSTSLSLSQQSTDPALNISKDGEDGEVVIHHNKLGINVANPTGSLQVKGEVLLDDQTKSRIMKVKETLSVTGKTELDDTQIGGKVKVNQPVEQANVDVHLRQSEQSNTALRVDKAEKGVASLLVKSGQVGINTETPKATLDVNGDVDIADTLAVQGPMVAHSTSLFKDHAYMEKNVAFSVDEPTARLHIAEQNMDTVAFRVDYNAADGTTSLVARQGKLGIGTTTPKVPLDVKGDSFLNGELCVSGTVHLDNYLNVSQDVVFDSDLVVKEKAKLKDQAIIGRADEIDPELMPNAQLYIADTHFKEALRIDSADYPSLVFANGKLGLGSDNPKTTLDVVGDAKVCGKTCLDGELSIEGCVTAYDNIDAHGKLDVSHKASFGSDVLIRGDLYIEDKTEIEEELTVTGCTELQDTLTVTGSTELQDSLAVTGSMALGGSLSMAGMASIGGELNVTGDTCFKAGLQVASDVEACGALSFSGTLSSGVNVPRAKQHIKVPANTDAVLFEREGGTGAAQTLMSLDRNGYLALGKASADTRLDVNGDATIAGKAVVQGALEVNSLLANTSIATGEVSVSHSIQLANGPKIKGFSNDTRLGGDYSANELVPTQAAVKAYIDNVVVPFGQGGKTYTISSQGDFDQVFNRGENTLIDVNTTILLLPLGNQDFNTGHYLLKNTVSLRSGVSIVGFNQAATRIAKSHANCRFEIRGTEHNPIENVNFEGFTFDGLGLVCARSGGALYLEHVNTCRFNCRFENHVTSDNGGALYGVMTGTESYTVERIEALHIHQCKALSQSGGTSVDRSEGGAAYGLDRALIHAYQCEAEHGGAVSLCRASQVVAEGCSASQKGGAAYRCPQLRMHAMDCSVEQYNGKGGAAYFCSDLICEGQWINNVAAEGPHIYASDHFTGRERECHYWKGDYVGRRIDDGTCVWHVNNE